MYTGTKLFVPVYFFNIFLSHTMKTILLLSIICILSTIGLFTALSMKTPWIGFSLVFFAWFIFIWITTKPNKF